MTQPNPGAAPESIVSLVPSTTDSFLALGIHQKLIGITDYCPWPEDNGAITRVGGPKDASVERILALKPALVIANQEENSKTTIEALEAEGIVVWVSFPRSVQAAMQDLYALASLYPAPSALLQVQWLERAITWLTQTRQQPQVNIFCPVWRSASLDRTTRWMSFSLDTYAADVLRLCGAENTTTLHSDQRYPEVAFEEIREAAPDAILLPSEPLSFGEEEAAFFQSELNLPKENVQLWDGRDLFWHGTRLGRTVQTLPEWVESIRRKKLSG
jgi:ABC-type Fe3+-hydroxamate transport system substrate-binding protein